MGRWRGRAVREHTLSASQQMFREQGINRTGMDQLCAAAQVSKRTAYQHFTGKDELVAQYLRRFDPSVLSGVFDRTDLARRERLLTAFDIPHHPPVPYSVAAVELHDPQHLASQYARDYKNVVVGVLLGGSEAVGGDGEVDSRESVVPVRHDLHRVRGGAIRVRQIELKTGTLQKRVPFRKQGVEVQTRHDSAHPGNTQDETTS